MLKCQEKLILVFALLIVLIKEKFKHIRDFFMEYFVRFVSIVSGDKH